MAKIKVDVDLVKRVLSVDEALELLAPHKEGRKQRVHTFVTSAIVLMGCDMDLTQVKKELKEAVQRKDGLDNIQIAGRHMYNMGHGIAYWNDKVGWTFLETDKAKLDAKINKRKLVI